MRSMPSSIFTTITSMAMMASSTRRPSARMRAPSVMRSKNRPVSSMMRNTAASVSGRVAPTTTPPGVQTKRDTGARRGRAGGRHDDADAPAHAEQADQQHDAERHRELEHEL